MEPRKYSEDLTSSTIKPFEEYSKTEAIAAEFNDKAVNAIFGAVDSTHYKLISNCDNAKEAWDILEVTHEGDEEVKTAKYQILMTQYENLRMDDKEKITEFHGRVRDIAHQVARLNEPIPENKLVLKVLRSFPKEYDMDVKAIRRSHNIKAMTLDALMGILESIELDMMEDSKRWKPDKQIAFSSTEAEDDSEHDLSLDEDFQEQLSLFTRQFKKQWMQKKGNQRMEGTSKGPIQIDIRPREVKYPDSVTYVKKKRPQCFECGGYGHIQSECANNLKKKRQAFTATWSDEEIDEHSDHGEYNCAFIACENSDLEDSLAEQLEDLQEMWAELLMVNKRNVVDKNRLLSEMDALKQNIEESKHKINKLEGENSNLRYEIDQLKPYQKWIKVAGADVLDHHSLMAKPPGDMTCIGFTNIRSTSKSQEIKFVKELEEAPPEYQVKRSLLNSTRNNHHTSYRCYRCREWGHVKRQCIKKWSKQFQIDRHKALIKEAEVKKKKLAIILSSLDTNTGSTAQPQGEKSQEDAPEEDDATQGEQSEGDEALADEDSDFEAKLHKPPDLLPDDTQVEYDRCGLPALEVDYDDPDDEIRADMRDHNRYANLALAYYNDKHVRECVLTPLHLDISPSDAYASEESPSSSSSTGSSSPDFEHRSVPNTTVPEPQPVNQMPGQVFQERDEPVNDEPAPYDPDNESYEGWVNRLEAMGEVGPKTLERLAEDSPPRSLQLEEKLKGVEAHNRELQDLIARQLDEMANLSAIAGRAKAETLQLKEENLKLMEDLELKEREFPGRAKQWVGENLEDTARVITSTPEVTMEAFKFIYREPNEKEMVTQVGSYGFMSGQKRDREATHAILAERDPAFSADAYGLAPIPDEEPEPPFPLE
ncbi:unnamed protein product [Cuscuta campestris]|uniref:CCHC-type domain-containing protein n=1 Tax=Cuscuta campestris TaxID=132261 RepID=A0A484L0I4_9ASTE|nr:unnamed protein product [Cuscuta campestris]